MCAQQIQEMSSSWKIGMLTSTFKSGYASVDLDYRNHSVADKWSTAMPLCTLTHLGALATPTCASTRNAHMHINHFNAVVTQLQQDALMAMAGCSRDASK